MLEHHTITHPAIPERLDGLTVLHLSDFHARWSVEGGRHAWWGALAHAIASVEVDLVALTGDYHDKPGHEEQGIELVRAMARVWRARFGAVGIHGNHDTARFRRMAAGVSEVRWIGGEVVSLDAGARGEVRVGGMDWPEDVVGVMRGCATRGNDDAGLEPASSLIGWKPMPLLMLAHVPTSLIACAEFGVPIVLAGHTHAGQVRVSRGFSPHTSSDTPRTLAGGLLRYRDTLCAVSRGVGDGIVEGLRINCPRQVCVYTLRRGAMAPWGDGAGARREVGW